MPQSTPSMVPLSSGRDIADQPPAQRRGRLPAGHFQQVLLGALVLVWIAVVAVGLYRIRLYETTPGDALTSPPMWPGSDLVSPHSGKATLLMFVHPRCACTDASLLEMEAIADAVGGRASIWILLMRPAGVDEQWNGDWIRERVRHIANARLLTDDQGAEAARFGAATSGHVVLYDARGALLFAGGITETRGHAGDNPARRTVIAAVKGERIQTRVHPVLGCGFHDRRPRSS